MSLAVDLAPGREPGLRLRNPVMVASGTFGYGTEYAGLVDIQRLGAIVCKGTTLRPRRGNPTPRTAETPAGLLNSIGLQNIGVRALVREKAPIWAKWSVPVLVNIAGESTEEYAEIARILDEAPGVAGIEVNVSCPNVAAGGMTCGVDPVLAAEVTAAVREATTLPVMVKLTPNVTDIVSIAEAVVGAGADALSLVNTFVGMIIDINTKKPLLGAVTGGLSGPAIRPIALRMVYEVAQAVPVPVVGVGGITDTVSALQFLMAGAAAIQVGTATFVDPNTAADIIDGLGDWLEREGISDIREIVGAALPKDA
ncbi:MAG: dihydroorotate dehydrogenase [Bacteroidetes bacterium]|nr:dihydroorotate dehydrogenase [Bacteroidota bacterium]MCL5025454.1 dihydroorotate dehydrogenase [Chloroflexota bacterium]